VVPGRDAAQTLATVGLDLITNAYTRPPLFRPTDPAFGLQFSGIGALACAMGSYVFFLVFIQKEGVQHVQALTELSIAHRIQERLVPIVKLRCGAFDVYGHSRPSAQVGGDSMAIVERAGVFYAYIADVSGHRLQSRPLMSMLVSSLRTAMWDAPPLAAVLERVNGVLPEVKEAGMYATFGGIRLGRGSAAEGILAGHPPVLHYRAAQCDIVEAGEAQLPLGLFKNATYSGFNLVIEPGDLLLLITDGLLDVTNTQGDDFGLDRIKRLLADLASQAPEQIVTEMFSAVKGFGPQTDDQTLLLLKMG
jgi:sigma-B regulation protein RsbU (phosphoserine phosphatase)